MLCEHKNGVDHDLGKALLNSKSSSAYDLANEIRTDPTYLDILKDSVEVHGHKTTLFGFCFHFGLFYEKGDYEERVAATLKIVRAAARLLGDREEYNAYKHSMRVVPNPLKMMLFKSQANRSREDLLKEKPDLTFETDAAVSFWTRIPKNNKELADEPVRSKSLHSPRDLNLATLCSMLITNIICARKPHFGADKNYKAWDDVYLPTKAKVDEALDQGPPIDDVEFRTTYVDLGRE